VLGKFNDFSKPVKNERDRRTKNNQSQDTKLSVYLQGLRPLCCGKSFTIFGKQYKGGVARAYQKSSTTKRLFKDS
jgi:hypothetical protein